MEIKIFLNEFKWRIIYSFLTYFLTLIVCIDSWEYLLIFELTFLKDFSIISNSFIFSKLLDGQKLVYILSFYYSFLFSSCFIFLQICLFLIPGLFKSEIYNLFRYLIYFINLFFGYFLNNFIFFPLICKDLLQYQYNNLSDRILNINVEYLMNINDIIFLKIKISFLLTLLLNTLYLIYRLQLKNTNVNFFILKNKKKIYILFLFSLFIFFENDFYLIFFFFILCILIFEYYFFLVLLLKKYKNISIIR